MEATKILVIDDSKTIRRTAETLLTKEGCTVYTAVDGFDALAKIADHHPDVIDETIAIIVAEVNTAPVLDPIGTQNVDEEATLSFTATASDSDLPADTLTFSLDAAAEALGMTITSGGDFSWTPTEAQGGATYSATIGSST